MHHVVRLSSRESPLIVFNGDAYCMDLNLSPIFEILTQLNLDNHETLYLSMVVQNCGRYLKRLMFYNLS